jgi:cytochrome P450 family 135
MAARPIPFMEAMRRRYGRTWTARFMRLGRIVFISDPASLKALFGADRVNRLAPGRNLVLLPLLGPRSLLLTDGPEHLARRKLMLPYFHGKRMRAYERVMEEAAERRIASWPVGERFSLQPEMQAIALEVMMRAVFGVADNRDDLQRPLSEILAATRSPRAIGLTIPVVRNLGSYGGVRRTIAETDEVLAAEIAARRSDPEIEAREDVLSLLISARDEEGNGMSDEELRDQLMTLLLAGHETTATSLAWAFDLLFRRPEALERLRAEVQGEEHAYLDAVVEETLRMRPVFPMVSRELRQPSKLDGYELPAGTVVMAALYLAHTNEDVFPRAHEFRPERFIDGSPDTYSWVPFGGGTRRCIGAAFAQFEMRVVLRTILRAVELAPGSPEAEQIVRPIVTMGPKQGTPAIVERRVERVAATA